MKIDPNAPAPTNNGLPEHVPSKFVFCGLDRRDHKIRAKANDRCPQCVEVEILPLGSRDRLRELEAFVLSVSSHYSGSLDHQPPYVSRARSLSPTTLAPEKKDEE